MKKCFSILVLAAMFFSAAFTSCNKKDEEKKEYIVTFNSNGGSAVSPQTVAEDEKVTKPTNPTREGYTFRAWYKEAALNTEWDFANDVVTSDITLYAGWSENSYEVSFESNGGSAVFTQTIAEGGKVVEPAPPAKDGSIFGGWFKDDTFQNQWNFNVNTVDRDITLYAKWIQLCTVTFNSNEGTEVDPQTVAEGEKAEEPITPVKDGYVFGGWFTDDEIFAIPWNFEENTVSEDIELYAKWIPLQQFTVNFDSNGGSEVGSKVVTEGSNVNEPNPPAKEGFLFDGWFKDDDNFEEPWNFANDIVEDNITLYAKWYEQMDKSKFNHIVLAGDNTSTVGDRPLPNLWDGTMTVIWVTNTTATGINFPWYFTLDIGVVSELRCFALFGRNEYQYTQQPREFSVWGTDELKGPSNNDPYYSNGSWKNDWTFMGDFKLEKPSGDGPEVTQEDLAFYRAGFTFNIGEDFPAVRYLRFEIKNTWGGNAQIVLAEIYIYER